MPLPVERAERECTPNAELTREGVGRAASWTPWLRYHGIRECSFHGTIQWANIRMNFSASAVRAERRALSISSVHPSFAPFALLREITIGDLFLLRGVLGPHPGARLISAHAVFIGASPQTDNSVRPPLKLLGINPCINEGNAMSKKATSTRHHPPRRAPRTHAHPYEITTLRCDPHAPGCDRKAFSYDRKARRFDRKLSRFNRKARGCNRKASRYDPHALRCDRIASRYERNVPGYDRIPPGCDERTCRCDVRACSYDDRVRGCYEKA
jgi:hypothetical protein